MRRRHKFAGRKRTATKTFLSLLIIASLVCAVPSVFYLTGSGGYIRQGLQSALLGAQKGLSFCKQKLLQVGDLFTDRENLLAQIRMLQAEKIRSDAELARARGLQQENEALSKLLELKQAHQDWSFTVATVASVENENYSVVYTLDRGTNAGIDINMPVLTDLGLVGYVFDVAPDYCRVRALTDSRTVVAVSAPQSGQTGLLEGDMTLNAQGLCRMNRLLTETQLQPGEIVQTAGGSSIYPAGLYIGTVRELCADAQTLQVYAVIELGQAADDIYRVMVLTSYTSTSVTAPAEDGTAQTP